MMFKQLYSSSVEVHENVTFFRQHFGYLYRSVLAMILLVCFMISAFIPWTFRIMLNASLQQAVPIFCLLGAVLFWAMRNLQFHEFIHPNLPASLTEFKPKKGGANSGNAATPVNHNNSRKSADLLASDPKLTEDWVFVYNTNGDSGKKKFCLYEKEKVGFGNPYAEEYKVLAIGSMQWFNWSHGWWTPFAINKATRPTTFTVEPVFPNTSAVQILDHLSDNIMEVTSEFRLQVGVGRQAESNSNNNGAKGVVNNNAGNAGDNAVQGEKLYLTQRAEGGFVYCFDYTMEEHLSEMYTWRLKRFVHKEPFEDLQSELWFMQNVGTGDYLKAEKSWYSGTKNLNDAAKFCVYS